MSVWGKLIKDLGYVSILTGPDCSLTGNMITLEEFCRQRPEGTYIVLNGDNKSKSNHLTAVIDGNIYDSWDSSGQIVDMVWVVEEGKQSEDVFKADGSMLWDDLIKVLDPFFIQQHKKMPYAEFSYKDLKYQDTVKDGLGIKVSMTIDTHSEMPAYDGTYSKRFVLKLNPRKSYSDQYKQVIEKCRVAIREWVYSYRKDIEDLRRLYDINVNPRFRGSRELLIKLPDWVIPIAIDAVDNGAYRYSNRYEVIIEALDSDPRKDETPDVVFRADTIPELKNQLKWYKQDFSRFNYDY